MFYWLIPLIIGILLLGVFLYFRVKEKRLIAVIIKGCVSLMFIATALVAWLTSKNPNHMFGLFVVIALVFGWTWLRTTIKNKTALLVLSILFVVFAVLAILGFIGI